MPRRFASNSMSRGPPRSVPITTELTTEALSELLHHPIGDLLFTVDEVQQLIDML